MFRAKLFGRQKILIFVIGIFLLASTETIFGQDAIKKWHSFDFSKKMVSKAELNKLELYDVEMLRGVVFGKRGRMFKETTIQDYLRKQAWYKPNPNFTNAVLTPIERKNIDLIREVEAEKHDFIQPGDLRFWEGKTIVEDKLSPNTAAEWQVLIAEIEAIHGKTFPDEPWLQKYFEERYWYKANPNYNPAALSEGDRNNLSAIIAARDKQRKVAVSPGDMDKFQDALLTEKMLEGVTINEARVMRNEFWARHGKSFSAPGVRAFFVWQDWYKPLKNQKLVKLNETEEANVKTLETYEKKLREKLTTDVLTAESFDGLFTEDLRVLRNEIYARHGRVFKDVKLQKEFAAMDWYKPDPNYTDSVLTPTEQENLKLIVEAEKNATSKFTEIEG